MNSTWFRDSSGRESKFTYKSKQGLWSEVNLLWTTQQEVLTSRRCDLESDTTRGLELTLKGIRTWMCILTRLWEGLGRPPGSRPEATLAPSRGQVCGHSHACQFCQEVVWLGLREAVITSLMKEEQKEEQRMRRAFEKSWYVHSAAPACFWNPSIPMTRPVCDLWWAKNWVGMGARTLGGEMKGKRWWGQKEGHKSVQRDRARGEARDRLSGSLAGHCISEQQHAKCSGTTGTYSSQKHSSLPHTSATQKACSHVFISAASLTGLAAIPQGEGRNSCHAKLTPLPSAPWLATPSLRSPYFHYSTDGNIMQQVKPYNSTKAQKPKVSSTCHRLNGHEFEQTPGDSEGQGSPECCSPWGHRESNMTEWLNKNKYFSVMKTKIILEDYSL